MLIDPRQFVFNLPNPRLRKPLPWSTQRIARRFGLSPAHAALVADLAGIRAGAEV